MGSIIKNNYKKEYIVVASRPGVGKTYTLLNEVTYALENNKKVLFISLDNTKEMLCDRLNIDVNDNLTIVDDYITDLNTIENLVITNKPDILMLDYIDLLSNKVEANDLLSKISEKYNIAVIVTTELGRNNIGCDLETIPTQEFKSINKTYMIEKADSYILLYKKDNELCMRKIN